MSSSYTHIRMTVEIMYCELSKAEEFRLFLPEADIDFTTGTTDASRRNGRKSLDERTFDVRCCGISLNSATVLLVSEDCMSSD